MREREIIMHDTSFIHQTKSDNEIKTLQIWNGS